MNRERAKELLPIIQAFAEGKTIQRSTGTEWVDIARPDWSGVYRIKPEPREFWVHKDLDQILRSSPAVFVEDYIHMKEVIE